MRKVNLIFLIIAIFIYGCDKDNSIEGQLPTISTNGITEITSTTAVSGGNIIDDGGLSITARGVCWSISTEPTINDAHTTDGKGIGDFTSNLAGLTEWNKYDIRAYATNAKGTVYGERFRFVASNPIADYDGNLYKTVKIGSQIWMAANLKTTHYADGTEIPLVTDNTAWSNLTTPAYSWYNNDEAANGNAYGALYNWHTVGAGNVCPIGWHVPSYYEWRELKDFIAEDGLKGKDGMALKSDTGWYEGGNGIDTYCFSALPGGIRNTDGIFEGIEGYCFWWSSTEWDANNLHAWNSYVSYEHNYVNIVNPKKVSGYSIRCVRD